MSASAWSAFRAKRSRHLGLVLAVLGLGACKGTTPAGAEAIEPPPEVVAAVAEAPAARRMPEGEAQPPRLALGTHGAVSSAELNASQVGVEILKKGGKARNLKVTVLDVDVKNDAVKLEVSIPEFDFKTTTNHKKGGRLMVAHKRSKDSALFLAVTPKLAPAP